MLDCCAHPGEREPGHEVGFLLLLLAVQRIYINLYPPHAGGGDILEEIFSRLWNYWCLLFLLYPLFFQSFYDRYCFYNQKEYKRDFILQIRIYILIENLKTKNN